MSSHDWEILIRIVVILILGWLAHRIVGRVIKRTVRSLQGERVQRGLHIIRRRTPKALLNTDENITLRRAQRADTIGGLLRSASTVIIVVIVFFAVLGQFDLNLTPLVAWTTVLTAVLGFGAQNIVRDFLAGFFIVVEDQYGVGDVIYLDATTNGTVEDLSLRITQMRGADGTLWSVPNGEIKKIGNRSQKWARAVVEFHVDLDTDILKAIHLMNEAADDMWHDSAYAGVITDEPEIWAPEAIDTDGILLKVAVKTRPLEQWRISRTLRSRIKTAFDREGIRIATLLPDQYPSKPGR